MRSLLLGATERPTQESSHQRLLRPTVAPRSLEHTAIAVMNRGRAIRAVIFGAIRSASCSARGARPRGSSFPSPMVSGSTSVRWGVGNGHLSQGLSAFSRQAGTVLSKLRPSAKPCGEAGLAAAGYHAGMDPDERAAAQHRFMTGDAEVITARAPSAWERQGQRPLGLALGDPDERRGLLRGGRARRPRRPPRPSRPPRRPLRPGPSGPLDPGRAPRVHLPLRPAPRPAPTARATSRSTPPRLDEDLVKLAIAERAVALEVEPAPGGRLGSASTTGSTWPPLGLPADRPRHGDAARRVRGVQNDGRRRLLRALSARHRRGHGRKTARRLGRCRST